MWKEKYRDCRRFWAKFIDLTHIETSPCVFLPTVWLFHKHLPSNFFFFIFLISSFLVIYSITLALCIPLFSRCAYYHIISSHFFLEFSHTYNCMQQSDSQLAIVTYHLMKFPAFCRTKKIMIFFSRRSQFQMNLVYHFTLSFLKLAISNAFPSD
jgi:hypothetical protein